MLAENQINNHQEQFGPLYIQTLIDQIAEALEKKTNDKSLSSEEIEKFKAQLNRAAKQAFEGDLEALQTIHQIFYI